jgi:hypothetical protein
VAAQERVRCFAKALEAALAAEVLGLRLLRDVADRVVR